MYQVKESGRNHWMYFTAQMNIEAVERYALTNELRRAAERGELVLHFQPIFAMGSMAIDSLEVLLRWQHPVRGLVPPAQFIGLAEASGLIVPIGEWVLRAACRQLAAWQRTGLTVPRLALNLSSIQVRLPGFGQQVAEMLAEHGIDPSTISFEITEGTLMSKTDEVLATLRRLSDLGIRLAIDDFGTGFSSLNYLKTLPIDTLKIDRSFVTDISDDPDDAAIVIAVLSMARGLQLDVIAEGVETERQLAFLRAHGCRLFQGFLSGAPMPAEAIARLLARA
jgi:EAL domain-containing protein (putative c-di-GMP-specific phosphodiesterase class I)